jgi:DNA polymerase III delta prime subunit
MNTVTKKNSFLVSGEAGVGKSYYIRNEARIHNAKLFRWNVRIDRSLREGREILHTQVRSKDKLYVWIEGADDLTQEAQAFLRRILETSSANVTSMLEVRETWKLSQPIISRCIPICITRNRSFRSERSYQIAQQLNLYKSNSEIDVKNMKLNDIIELRKKAYDPIHIIYSIVKEYGINNKDVLNIFKKIGAGYSPWIQLAYFLSAFSSKTKDT